MGCSSKKEHPMSKNDKSENVLLAKLRVVFSEFPLVGVMFFSVTAVVVVSFFIRAN